jgi:hypothetical protein
MSSSGMLRRVALVRRAATRRHIPEDGASNSGICENNLRSVWYTQSAKFLMLEQMVHIVTTVL